MGHVKLNVEAKLHRGTVSRQFSYFLFRQGPIELERSFSKVKMSQSGANPAPGGSNAGGMDGLSTKKV